MRRHIEPSLLTYTLRAEFIRDGLTALPSDQCFAESLHSTLKKNTLMMSKMYGQHGSVIVLNVADVS